MRLTYLVLLLTIFVLIPQSLKAATGEIRTIIFPTDKSVTFHDDFGEPRAGHAHEGIDMLGKKMMPLYAAVDGMVSFLTIPEASWGYEISLRDADGYTYNYIHVNNDNPGTDDGAGGIEHAYAPGVVKGAHVVKGQLIGWMGDSGNAENVGAHLHFEIRLPNDTPINPYPSLIAAGFPGSYNVLSATTQSPDINTDKSLVTMGGTPSCVSGSLIKSASSTAVYYCGADSKRYVFPNDKIYFSWYADFKKVTTITVDQLAAVPLGGNVTYRPGIKMVKIESLPNVYAIQKGGVLRWVQSPEIASALYGTDWKKKVDDISDAFFGSYTIGEPVASAH